MQEAIRKDVERCFGMLQLKWDILQQAIQKWERMTIQDIVIACVILHNMKKEDMLPPIEVDQEESIIQTHDQHVLTFQEYFQGSREVEDILMFLQLQYDFIDHHWARKGMMKVFGKKKMSSFLYN